MIPLSLRVFNAAPRAHILYSSIYGPGLPSHWMLFHQPAFSAACASAFASFISLPPPVQFPPFPVPWNPPPAMAQKPSEPGAVALPYPLGPELDARL